MTILNLAELKAQLGIDDTVDDAMLTVWVDSLEGRFVQYLHRKIAREVGRVQYFSGDGVSDRIYLDLFPVEEITEVTIEGEATTNYSFRRERGILTYFSGRGTAWPRGNDNVKVTWTGGYVPAGDAVGEGQTAMPKGLRRAMLYQATYEWRNRENLGLRQSGGDGSYQMQAPPVLLQETKESLGPFRRIL